MPGYPKVDRESDFLISRFDGAILDAKPWGRGFPEEPQTAESLGYTGALSEALTQLHSLEVNFQGLLPNIVHCAVQITNSAPFANHFQLGWMPVRGTVV